MPGRHAPAPREHQDHFDGAQLYDCGEREVVVDAVQLLVAASHQAGLETLDGAVGIGLGLEDPLRVQHVAADWRHLDRPHTVFL
ncbi:hypothetical protein Plhal304r1_c001g0004031 [Plasmopara halstedii]